MCVKGRKMLATKDVLEGLKSIDMGHCESYIIGKKKWVSFTKFIREPKKIWLKMVYKDILGPSSVHHLVDQSSTSPSSMISANRFVFIS